MKPEGRRIPDVLLHRYLASALEGESLERVEKLLAESEVDRTRLEELRAETNAFLANHPPGPLIARIERSEKERKSRRWWWSGALAAPVLTGLAALTFMLVRPEEPPSIEHTREPRTKGVGVALTVLRHQAEAEDALVETDDELAPGDILRLEVRSATPGFLAVVGRDATSKVFVYYPKEAREPVPIAEGLTEVPAFSLGESPGSEEVHALFSPAPFELAPVLRALEAGSPVKQALPPGVKATSQVLRKKHAP
jgi:hypothetical protein